MGQKTCACLLVHPPCGSHPKDPSGVAPLARRHGFGHWDQVAGDTRLGLDAKLEAAAVEKHGRSYEPPDDLKHLPKGARGPYRPSRHCMRPALAGACWMCRASCAWRACSELPGSCPWELAVAIVSQACHPSPRRSPCWAAMVRGVAIRPGWKGLLYRTGLQPRSLED